MIGYVIFEPIQICVVDLKRNWSSQFLTTFDSLVVLTTHSDVKIWRFSCWRQTDKPITLPLAHACGVIQLSIPDVHSNTQSYYTQDTDVLCVLGQLTHKESQLATVLYYLEHTWTRSLSIESFCWKLVQHRSVLMFTCTRSLSISRPWNLWRWPPFVKIGSLENFGLYGIEICWKPVEVFTCIQNLIGHHAIVFSAYT